MNFVVRSLLISGLLVGGVFAEEGKTQYETYCGACHGLDGRGASEGQFPPLAGSMWVKGTSSRMLQVVLHGLQGEVAVPGVDGKEKVFNLAMPPQGAALTDEQIAAIATYVRSSWGNKGAAVTPQMVAKERKATVGRKEMWTAASILKRHPLPGQKRTLGRIENLIARVYDGKFRSLAELRKAKPASVEEEKGGLISLRHAGNRKEGFGLIWSGELVVPKAGDYFFELDSDDGSALFVGKTKVAEVKGLGPMGRTQKGKISLKKGRHPIRVEYFELSGGEGIALQWRGPRLKPVALSERKTGKPKKARPSIPLRPLAGEAVMYRNFIEGTSARAIGVGYDCGLNLAFSADTMAVELLWTGDFLDGGLHWTARGQGNTKPQGEVIKLGNGPVFAILPKGKTAWPQSYGEQLAPRFQGYSLDEKKQPTFYYRLGGLEVSDFPEAKGGEANPNLARRIRIEAGENPPANLVFRVFNSGDIKALGKGGFRLGARLSVQIGGPAAGKPVVRGNALLLPLHLKPGPNEFLLNYTLE